MSAVLEILTIFQETHSTADNILGAIPISSLCQLPGQDRICSLVCCRERHSVLESGSTDSPTFAGSQQRPAIAQDNIVTPTMLVNTNTKHQTALQSRHSVCVQPVEGWQSVSLKVRVIQGNRRQLFNSVSSLLVAHYFEICEKNIEKLMLLRSILMIG